MRLPTLLLYVLILVAVNGLVGDSLGPVSLILLYNKYSY